MHCDRRNEGCDVTSRRTRRSGLAVKIVLILLMAGSLPIIVSEVTKRLANRHAEVPALGVDALTAPAIDTPMPAAASTLLPLPSPFLPTVPEDVSELKTWKFSEAGLLVDSAVITKYGRHLVVSFTDGRLMVHNLQTGKEQFFKSSVEFSFLQLVDGISSNQAGILVADYLLNEGGNVTLWQVSPDGESRSVANIVEPDYFLTALAISPDGETLALGYNNGEIRLFRTSDGAQTHAIPTHKDFVMSLEFSWDDRYLLSDSFSFDPFTYVIRLNDGVKVATLATESYEPGRISFSPDSRFAAVTSFDGTHMFSTDDWLDKGFVMPTFDGKFTCDSRGVIAFTDGREEMYSVSTGELIQSRDVDSTLPVSCLFDGRTVSISVDLPNNTVTLLLLEH